MSTEDDRDDLRAALDAYEAPPPPAGLADSALARARTPARRGRPVLIIGAAIVAGLAMIAVSALWRRTGDPRAAGEVVAAGRRTEILGARAVAVAEAGAAFRYAIDGRGAARVDQTAGDVFYRVAPGGPFVVSTPAGSVTVEGTCFRVEVPMTRKDLVAGAVGAAISAAVLVTVYEGRVLLAGERGAVRVDAGERGVLRPGEVPAPVVAGARAPAASAQTRDELLTRDLRQRQELATARARILVLERQVEGSGRSPQDHSAPLEPTPAELTAWARKCEVHIDAPSIFGDELAPLTTDEAREWGITEEEARIVDGALASIHEQARQQIRAFYIEATGDRDGADALSMHSMMSEIWSKSLPGERAQARARMARERAGLAPAPAAPDGLPPIERLWRLLADAGNGLERTLATRLGSERARDLRKLHGGWGGLRYNDEGCPE